MTRQRCSFELLLEHMTYPSSTEVRGQASLIGICRVHLYRALNSCPSSLVVSSRSSRPQFFSKIFFFCSRVTMCYQKVSQNWRKSKPLLSPEQSRFSPLHTVTPWTPQAPANSRPHSTSSQPPPMGTGAAKCTSPSRSLQPAARVQSSHHSFSFGI